MLGAVPSDFISYFDFNRFAEYLVDGTEVAPANPSQLDANTRAINIVNAAQGDVAAACRKGDYYELQQLRDLVRAGKSSNALQASLGAQILDLIADCAWCRATRRKRYTKASPQGEDPSCEIAENKLEQLRHGERIFVLDGVEQTDGAGNVLGVYGEAVERAGVMEGSQLVAETIDNAVRLWGCKTGGSTMLGGTGRDIGAG